MLTKETAITTPFVFAAWLWLRDKRRKQALYFLAPALALAGWLAVLHHSTGYWLGNQEFTTYNATGTLEPFHIFSALLRRAWFLFVSDGNFLGTLALYLGWRILKGRDWTITAWVAAAQVLVVVVFGGAVLERYLLPVLPIVYVAMAAAASVYPASWRRVSHVVMIALLVAGWFWNPPYPFPFENNLAMVNFIRLQEEAASYLEAYAPDERIASAWPFTDELKNPDLGYVQHPLKTVDAGGLRSSQLAALDRRRFDLLVVYKRITPAAGTIFEAAPLRDVLQHYYEYYPQATEAEIRAAMGFVPLIRWERRGQWIEIYGPMGPRRPVAAAALPVRP